MSRSSRIYIAMCKVRHMVIFANTVKYEFVERIKQYPYPDELKLFSIGDNKMENVVEIVVDEQA